MVDVVTTEGEVRVVAVATQGPQGPAGSGGGFVDISGTPVATDFARFIDVNTVEGRSPAETRADLSLEVGIDVQGWSAVLDGTTASFLVADETKLDAIETAATADQTGAEIKTAYQAEVSAFTDALFTKLSNIETAATADQTGAEIKTAYQAEVSAFTDALFTKLSNIETSATADQTGAEIKTAYQAEVSAFTDALFTKLSNIETSATADQTAGEIEAIVNHDDLIGFVAGEHFLQSAISITLSQVSDSGALAALATVGTSQIDDEAVTLAKMQHIPTANLLGRVTAATGDVEDLTATQATTILNNFTSALKGLTPSSGGGTTNFLRADGTWNTPAGGGNVSNVATPLNDQLAVWTSATSIEGTTGLTYNGTALDVTGNITLTGTVDGINIAVDVAANTVKNTNVPTALSTGTVTATTYGITSDGGADDVVLPEATTTVAGLLGAAKWDEIVANTLKVANATHTGQVTGAEALALDITAVTAQPAAGALIGADTFIVNDGGVLSEITGDQMSTFFGGGAEVNNLTVAVTWANVPNANITAGSVTQHVGAIDHDQTLNFLAAEHVDWAGAGAGTIHTDNYIENVPTALSVGTVGVNTVAITSDGGADDVTLPAATISAAGMLTTAKWAEIIANNAKATNVSTTLSVGTVTTTTVAITSDGGADDVVLPAATVAAAGMLTTAKWAEIVANNAKATNVSTTLSIGTITGTTYAITSDGSADDIILPVFNSTQAGLTNSSGGGTTNFLRADGTWAVPGAVPTSHSGATVIDPADGDSLTFFVPSAAITITGVSAHRQGGTSVIFNIEHGTNPSAPGTSLWSANETVTADTTLDQTFAAFNDATVLADNIIKLEIVTVTGAVTEFHATIEYTVD